MTKYNFLNELERRLVKLPEEDKRDILQDYEEHFTFAVEAGKTDAEVIEQLGSPEKIAKEVAADYHVELARETNDVSHAFKAVFAVGALGFFNLVFVLAPAIAIGAVLFAFAVSGAAFIVSPVLLLFFSAIRIQTFTWFDFCLSLALSGLGIFISMAAYYMIKWAIGLTMRYLALNLRLVKGGKSS